MLISSPTEVMEFVRSIPKGMTMTAPQVRDALAEKHGAQMTCPLTTSIFLRIVAEAAWDEYLSGRRLEEVTPFWRAIGPKDKVTGKLRCGPEFIVARRAEESFSENGT
jgi:hypothetical protein